MPTQDTAEDVNSRTRLRAACLAELARRGWQAGFEEPLRGLYARRQTARRPAELRRLYRISCVSYMLLFSAFNIPLFRWEELPLVIGLLMLGPAFLLVSGIFLRPGRSAALREGWALGSATVITVLSTMTPALNPPVMALCGFFLAAVPVIWVLIFLRLRLRDAVIFTAVATASLGIALSLRPDIDPQLRLYPFMFMIAAALPALAAMRGMEHAARRVFLHTLLQKLQMSDMAEQNIRLESLSNTDPLTGIANRRRLDSALADCLTQPCADDALLLVDIDHFKQFNDVHGHLAGDEGLRAIARLIAAQLRPGDLLARFGGEEFAVLLPCTGQDAAMALADRIRAAVAAGRPLGVLRPEQLTVSIGIADRTPNGDAELLIARADAALYAAKRAGRNCVRAAADVWGTASAPAPAPAPFTPTGTPLGTPAATPIGTPIGTAAAR